MEAVEALALAGGHVNEELPIKNEYLATENRILKSKLKKPVQFNNGERIQLAKIGKRIGLSFKGSRRVHRRYYTESK